MKIRTIIVSLITLTAIALTSCLETTEEEQKQARTKVLEQAEREAQHKQKPQNSRLLQSNGCAWLQLPPQFAG